MTLRPCCSGTEETMAGPSPASRLVSSGSNVKPLTRDPPGRLQCDGTLLSRADSHQAWVHHLTVQGSWPISLNQSFHASIESAAAHIGQGVFDGWIDDAEWHRAAERINTSRACTSFLLHRLLLKCATETLLGGLWLRI